MFDSYIILNRKPKIIIIIVVYILIFFCIYIYFSLNKITVTFYHSRYSYVKEIDDNYYLKLDVGFDDVNNIIDGNIIYINDNMYKYQIYKLEEGINNDSQIMYLEVFDFDEKYKINNYGVEVKIQEKNVKLIENIFV